MKKLLSVILALVTMLSVFSIASYAEPDTRNLYEEFWLDGICYYFDLVWNDDVTEEVVAVYDYDEDDALTNPNLVIPDTVEYDGISYPVREIRPDALASSDYETITLPSTITSIGYRAFENCENLQNVIIPDDCVLEYIGGDIFAGTPFEATLESKECVTFANVLYSYSGSGGYLIPSNITLLYRGCFENSDITQVFINNKIRIIPDNAFAGCKKLHTVIFGENVEYIGSFAFEGCVSLKYVTLNDSLETIDYGAFSNSGLREITLGVDTMFVGAFADCNTLEQIYLNENNKNLYANCTGIYYLLDPSNPEKSDKYMMYYYHYKAVGDVAFGNDVVAIYPFCFYGCKDLESVSAPRATTIYYYAFANSGIKEFKGNYVNYIRNNAFSNSRIEKFVGNSVTTIETEAFYNCYNLSSINLKKAESIDDSAFENCVHLTEIEFGKSLRKIWSRAFANTGIKELNIKKCEEIDFLAFANCENLETVKLNATVISSDVFSGCTNLKSVRYENVVTINNNQFTDCLNLETVYFSRKVDFITKDAFENCENVEFQVIKDTPAHEYVVAKGLNYKVVGRVTIFHQIIDFFARIFEGN